MDTDEIKSLEDRARDLWARGHQLGTIMTFLQKETGFSYRSIVVWTQYLLRPWKDEIDG